jgi:hypothetical protein
VNSTHLERLELLPEAVEVLPVLLELGEYRLETAGPAALVGARVGLTSTPGPALARYARALGALLRGELQGRGPGPGGTPGAMVRAEAAAPGEGRRAVVTLAVLLLDAAAVTVVTCCTRCIVYIKCRAICDQSTERVGLLELQSLSNTIPS